MCQKKEFEDYIISLGYPAYWVCPNHGIIHCSNTDLLREYFTTCNECLETVLPLTEKFEKLLTEQLKERSKCKS